MPDTDLALRVVALGCDIERATQRLSQVETRLRLVSEQLAELTRMVTETRAAPDSAVGSWLAVEDTDQAHEDVVELTGWLAAVYLRYPDAALPSCWQWHPAVVEELCWLRQAHQDAYHGAQACSARAADWHDRHRPGVVSRIRKWLRDCDLSCHTQPAPQPVVPLLGSAERLAEIWTTRRSTPVPTSEERSEADQYEHQQFRTKNR